MALSSINRYFLLLLICLINFGCSPSKRAQTDMLIEGPFHFNSEWKTIQFKKPLKVLPHIHELNLLFKRGQYKRVFDLQRTKHRIVSSGFATPQTETVIDAQVVLVARNGKVFKTVQSSAGHWKIDAGHFDMLNFSTNSREGKFIFPKGTEFVAVKIKSNVEIEVEHLYWFAYSYVKNPLATWDDVEPSEIVELQ